MRLGIVTTSRADFSIYLPLLRAVQEHYEHDLKIFVGGMHLSDLHGLTYKEIEKEGFKIERKIESISQSDTPEAISMNIARTIEKFADVWAEYESKIDVLFVLGDRYEMFAAAAASVPFNMEIAHLHGGETTLGAIDNKFRNAITSFAKYHFVSSEKHKSRVIEIMGADECVYNVGSLALEAIKKTELMGPDEFRKEFDFDLNAKFVLCTYHPETVDLGTNKGNISELINALNTIPYKVLCTLPNADTESNSVREALLQFQSKSPEKIKCVEHLGSKGYYTALKYTAMLVGNSSSGIIEAASFGKVNVNVGKRQEGRECGDNVIHVPNSAPQIINGVEKGEKMEQASFQNIFEGQDTAANIIKFITEQ